MVQLLPLVAPCTLAFMDDSWLAHGHGGEPVHLDTIFTSSASKRPVSLDLASDPTEQSSTGGVRSPRRSSRVAVVTALWFGIIVGTSGAAWAVRDALFPSVGPAEVSVWQNPGHDTEPPTSDDELETTVASTTATTIAVSRTEAATATSLEPHNSNDDGQHDSPNPTSADDGTKHGGDSTQPTVGADTPTSVDDHGGGRGGSGPSGDTAPDDGSGTGKGSDSGGGSGSGDSGSGNSGSGGGSGSGGSGSDG